MDRMWRRWKGRIENETDLDEFVFCRSKDAAPGGNSFGWFRSSRRKIPLLSTVGTNDSQPHASPAGKRLTGASRVNRNRDMWETRGWTFKKNPG